MKVYFPTLKQTIDVELGASIYIDGNLAIIVLDIETKEHLGKLTVNVPELNLKSDEVAIKTWSENEVWAENIVASRPDLFIEKVGGYSVPIWKLSVDSPAIGTIL